MTQQTRSNLVPVPPARRSAVAATAAFTTALALAAATGDATAQQQSIVPPLAAIGDMPANSYFPFIYDATRVQQVWDGKAIAPTIAIINGVAWRTEADGRSWPGRSIPNMTITLSVTSVTPQSMSTSFAGNLTGQPTTIHNGPYNIPTFPATTGVGQFLVSFPLSTPFMYNVPQGNLLLDLTIPGIAQQKQEHYLDAVRATTNGAVTAFGQSGSLVSRDTLRLAGAGPTVTPGSMVTMTISTRTNSYPASIFYGASSAYHLGVPLPYDLGPLGAPGNMLYTGPLVTLGVMMQQGASGWTGTHTVTLPNSPALAGGTFWSQGLLVDPPSNSLGLVFSNGVQVEVGGGWAVTQTLGASDSSAATGFFLFGASDPGGPVTMFSGTFG